MLFVSCFVDASLCYCSCGGWSIYLGQTFIMGNTGMDWVCSIAAMSRCILLCWPLTDTTCFAGLIRVVSQHSKVFRELMATWQDLLWGGLILMVSQHSKVFRGPVATRQDLMWGGWFLIPWWPSVQLSGGHTFLSLGGLLPGGQRVASEPPKNTGLESYYSVFDNYVNQITVYSLYIWTLIACKYVI